MPQTGIKKLNNQYTINMTFENDCEDNISNITVLSFNSCSVHS